MEDQNSKRKDYIQPSDSCETKIIKPRSNILRRKNNIFKTAEGETKVTYLGSLKPDSRDVSQQATPLQAAFAQRGLQLIVARLFRRRLRILISVSLFPPSPLLDNELQRDRSFCLFGILILAGR